MKAYSKPIRTEHVVVEEAPGVALHMTWDEAQELRRFLDVHLFSGGRDAPTSTERSAAIGASRVLGYALPPGWEYDGEGDEDFGPVLFQDHVRYFYDGCKRLDKRDPCAPFDKNYWRWDSKASEWVRR